VKAVRATSNKFWGTVGWGGAVIILLTVVVYLPALRGEFVFDDPMLITANPIVKANDGLHRFWFTTEAPDYYPLTWSLWWLEWRLWGASPMGYHVLNVLLHAVNAVLVWVVLRRLKIPGAWLAGLVFAIHPVNVATVAWISEQRNTLSMLFGLVATLLFLKFDEDRRWRSYGFSLAAFLLALLSKTAVVMLPVVLLGCVWWVRSRVRWKDFWYSVPFFALSLALALVTIWFQYNRALVGRMARADGFLSHLAAAGCVPWFYLYKALLPVNLTVIYPKWDIHAWRWAACVPGAVLAGCFVLLWWKRKTWGRPLLFGLGSFVAMLFPVMGFFNQGFYNYSLVADHWQYYSIIGVIALVVAGAVTIGRRMGERRRRFGTAVGVAALLALGMATWMRAGVYQNSEALWRDNVVKNPSAWLPHYNLGNVFLNAGTTEEAIRHYEQALRLKPDYTDAHVNLGDCLLRVGRVQEAIDHYKQALQVEPNAADVHNNLGFALVQAGKTEEAIQHYERALQINPQFAAAHYNLGNALLEKGRFRDAITHYERAVQITPDYPDAHNNLAFALLQEGDVQAAISHCEQALRTRPAFPEAHCNLGNALLQQGRLPEARAQYEEALRLKPDFAEAQDQLARVRAVR
jgi:tetratricopeptide (TPR) repeat protein